MTPRCIARAPADRAAAAVRSAIVSRSTATKNLVFGGEDRRPLVDVTVPRDMECRTGVGCGAAADLVAPCAITAARGPGDVPRRAVINQASRHVARRSHVDITA